MQVYKLEEAKRRTRRKVAVYARVSTLREEQEESYETQMRYYRQVIAAEENWQFVRIYADQGKSGAAASERPGFMRMIGDARKHSFDLILVKSISRFARNMYEANEYIRQLKELRIEVRFDQEQISSFDASSEMIFNLMAAMAQEEIRSLSERVKWSGARRMELGIRHIGSRHVLGYDEIDGCLVPNEDAWIIRQIFEDYAAGMNTTEIAKKLNEGGARTLRGRSPFRPTTVDCILRTIMYTGDRHLQQAPPRNYMTHRPDPSLAYTSMIIRGDHEGIVSKELWERVQKRRMLRTSNRESGVYQTSRSHYLYGHIFCAACGSPYTRRSRTRKGAPCKVWVCRNHVRPGDRPICNNPLVYEDEIPLLPKDVSGGTRILVETDGSLNIQ